MKKFILMAVCAVICCAPAYSWGRVGHSTVAYIAEQNLTPKAKKALKEYLHGNSIVSVAVLNDILKNKMKVDLGQDFDDSPRISALPHTFEVESGSFEPFRGIDDNGRYVKNCIWFIEKYAEDLRANAKHMDDSTRFAEITSIVHFVGDMHCPEHIRYNPDDMTIGYYEIKFKKKPLRFHTLWDDMIFTERRNWGFIELAYMMDHYSKKEIREWTKGDVWDWGKDSAMCSWPVHQVKPGDKLDKYYTLENQQLAEMQVVKAGHRLATVLNSIFR